MQWPLSAAFLAAAWLAPGHSAMAFQPGTPSQPASSGAAGSSDSAPSTLTTPPPGAESSPAESSQPPTTLPRPEDAAGPQATPQGPAPAPGPSVAQLQNELNALRKRVERAESRLRSQEERAASDDYTNGRQYPALGPNQWFAGQAMATRVTFAIADDNLLAGAKDRSPSAGFKLTGDRLFFEALEQRTRTFETETQFLVYKRVPTYFKRMDVEAAFVTELQQWHDTLTFRNYTRLRDDGSYIKFNWYTKRSDYTGDNVSLTLFPVDSQRFLLGYLYFLSWGGERMFPNNEGQTPGMRLRYDWNVGTGKDSYVFLGAKTARLLNERINEPQTYYALLGGYGIGFTPWLAWEANGGYFQSGAYPMFSPNSQIGGRTVHTFGGSTRLTFHWGTPLGTSIDYRLFRYSPDASYLLTQTQIYDNKVAGSASFEFTTVGQTLQAFESPDSTRIQPAKAGAFVGKLRVKKLRLFAYALFRDLQYMALEIPGVFPYQTVPRSAKVTPEWFLMGGLDYYFPKPRLTPGFFLAYKNPAALSIGDATTVYREFYDQEPLPQGEKPFDILGTQLNLKWDVSPFFVVIGELRYTLDNNRTKFVKAGNESGRIRVFEDPHVTNRLGFFLLAQARW